MYIKFEQTTIIMSKFYTHNGQI